MGVSCKVLDRSKGDGWESLGELNGFEGWLGMDKLLSLWSEDEGVGFSVATAFASSFLAPPCLRSPSAPPSISTLTVLLSAPTALLAVHS